MSRIMRELIKEARAARGETPAEVPEFLKKAEEPELCSHGLLMSGTCFLCGRWGGTYAVAPTTKPAQENPPWPFPIDFGG